MTEPRLTLASTPPRGSWVQVDRGAMEQMAQLTIANPRAAALLQVILSRIGEHNALVTSQPMLAKMAGFSLRTVQRSIAALKAGKWLEIRPIGATGTTSAYIVNDRVVWIGPRDGIRYSLFSATVVLDADEQPDKDDLGIQEPLHQLPTMLPGEQQLPVGEGLPPPSQPSLPSLEPDLPARKVEPQPPPAAPPIDPAVLAAWSGRPRNDRLRLALQVVAAQRATGEIPLDPSALADKPEELLAEAKRLGRRV